MAKNAGDDVRYEPFEKTIKRWALNSARQLKDAYKTQKVFNGTYNKAYEIWTKTDEKGRQRGWFDENARRYKNRSKADYWYSTGYSYSHSDVKVEDNTIVHGVVDFRTTLEMLYAEAGVGATGRHHARGRDISVDRKKNYKRQQRYIETWVPREGRTHRPNVRQQVNFLRRRLVWLADQRFLFNFATYLTYNISKTFDIVLKMDGFRPYVTLKKERDVIPAMEQFCNEYKKDIIDQK